MNKIIFTIAIAVSALCTACSKKVTQAAAPPPPQMAEVTFLGFSSDVLSLSASGVDYTQSGAVSMATQNAFETLFYRGIPGFRDGQPLIGQSEKEKSMPYFKEFYNEQRYKSFMTSMNLVSAPSIFDNKVPGKVFIELSINVSSLRRDLEAKGVIRKFGY